MRTLARTSLMISGLLVAIASTVGAVEDVYAPLSPEEARSRTFLWIAEQGSVDPARVEELRKEWTFGDAKPSAAELLDLVVRTFGAVDKETAKLVEACTFVGAPLVPPDPRPLQRTDQNAFYRSNLGLYYARYLSDRRMYDEALDVLATVDPKEVVDPAACFFLKAVAQQELLDTKEALDSLDRLLHHTEDVPVRYSTTASLMEHDLQSLKEKSLDEIARMMTDSERRLELARGGQKVQDVQEKIILNLDELIKKIEQQSGQGGGGGSGQQNRGNQSNNPLPDSIVKGSTAPGEVDKKKFNREGGWGNLPEKEQAKAKNLINRNFPSHYRQAIDTYFRKLANRPADK